MKDLRTLFDCTIHPHGGALLRSDGVAVGLVGGGAPNWDLLAPAEQAAVGDAYHRLLLALDAPLDVYQIDQPPALANEIRVMHERQSANPHPLQATVLGEMTEYLADLAHSSRSRAKQVVWAITVAPLGTGVASGLNLASLVRRPSAQRTASSATHNRPEAEGRALMLAQDKARHLASALHTLRSAQPPYLLSAEEIGRVLYRVADPVRAVRYELEGPLLDRLCRVVTVQRGGSR
jgi:xanthine/CO dehydrogenase XdhC/CoxF family maturation factor